MSLCNRIGSMLLSMYKISRVRIQSVETWADMPEIMPDAMAAVAENMKNATCAGEFVTHRSKSSSSRDIPRPEHLIPSAAAMTVIRAASGRKTERNCSIDPTLKRIPDNYC